MALIVPSVYADLVRTKIVDKVKVSNFAVDLGYLKNSTVGETVTFPKWKLLGNAVDVVKGVAVTTEQLDQDSSTATIKMVAPKGVMIYDMDNITALGNAIDEGASQQSLQIARKQDLDLITEALTSPLKSATAEANKITAAELNAALMLYGDEQDVEDFEGIVVHSLLLPSFIAMPEFTSIEKTYQGTANGVVSGGVIGYFRGYKVCMANHGTYDSVKAECITLIIKKRSLGIMNKRDIKVEEERQASLFRSNIFSNKVYAVKLLADDGVVVVRKTIV
jgi:hypothetical protein